MKTRTYSLFVILLILVSNFTASADVQLYGPVTPPAFGGTYWSMYWGSAYPPLPCIPLRFVNADCYGIVGVTNAFVYDDTSDPTHGASEMMTMDSGGSGDGDGPTPLVDYGTNLWIEIVNLTNQLDDAGTQQVANLFLHNTTAGTVYEVISSVDPSIPMTNWISEGLWLASGTNTATPVPVWTRTNELCFRGKVWDGTFSHGVATNGQLYLLCQDTNSIQGVINGITNTITPVYSNWVVLQPPVWTANFGFSGNDLGPTNLFSMFDQQNLHAVLGFSRSISNFALSFNPLSKIDTHDWPNLTYLEMWHATNLVAVNVTNCPKLYRVCFESIEYVDSSTTNGIKDVIDFTGCTNLADLRAANNNITNIIFGPNGGSNIWHFCTRDVRTANRSLPVIQGLPFASLPSLRQLWIWRDNSYVANVALTVTNSPQLESVQAYANFFQSARFDSQTNLAEILLSDNRLTNLILSGCTKLRTVDAQNNYLPASVVDSALNTLDTLGGSNGVAIFTGPNNGAPTTSGYPAIANLRAKGWTVFTNSSGAVIPQISNLAVTPDSNSATITWDTANIASDSTVYYGTTTSYGLFTNDDQLVTSHSMTITGLTTNTTYHFYVASVAGANQGVSGDNIFTTLGRAPNTNVIWFVSTSGNVSMQAGVDSGATVTWYWAGGGTSTGTNVSTNFGSAGSRSNAVIVDPASALRRFGVACQTSADTTLSEIGGLTNYPNLQGLYAYLTSLSSLSLAGCTNLNYAALVGTSPSTATANAWFNDLVIAQAGVSTIGTGGQMCGDPERSFFCQSGVVDNNSLSSRTTLTNKNWTIYFYP